MTLDAPTAAELLKAAPPPAATEIAAELVYLSAAGLDSTTAAAPIREFTSLLGRGGSASGGAGASGFVRQVLHTALGEERSREVLSRVDAKLESRDPFLAVRSAEVEHVAEALAGEAAPTVALVLSELPTKRSAKLLTLLDDTIRADAVRALAAGGDVSVETKVRVASVVRRRLDEIRKRLAASSRAPGENRQRKVAVLLRTLGGELRGSLLQAIEEQDAETAGAVRDQMVVWSDLTAIADRSMQEALREIEAKQLALAISGAEEAVAQKIRTNMSERAAAMLDEEMSLLSSPTPEEIQDGRDALLGALRALAAQDALRFEETSSE